MVKVVATRVLLVIKFIDSAQYSALPWASIEMLECSEELMQHLLPQKPSNEILMV